MAVLPEVTVVLLHHNAMDIWTKAIMLVKGSGELAVLPAVTAGLLISVLWIYGLTVMFVLQSRGGIAVCLQLLQFCYIPH